MRSHVRRQAPPHTTRSHTLPIGSRLLTAQTARRVRELASFRGLRQPTGARHREKCDRQQTNKQVTRGPMHRVSTVADHGCHTSRTIAGLWNGYPRVCRASSTPAGGPCTAGLVIWQVSDGLEGNGLRLMDPRQGRGTVLEFFGDHGVPVDVDQSLI